MAKRRKFFFLNVDYEDQRMVMRRGSAIGILAGGFFGMGFGLVGAMAMDTQEALLGWMFFAGSAFSFLVFFTHFTGFLRNEPQVEWIVTRFGIQIGPNYIWVLHLIMAFCLDGLLLPIV